MKKIIATILAISISVILTGCSLNTEKNNQDDIQLASSEGDVLTQKYGDYVYFTNCQNVYRIKENGGKKELLAEIPGEGLTVYGDFLYFMYYSQNAVYRVSLDGKNLKRIITGATYLQGISRGKIYYFDFISNLWCANLDGSEVKMLVDFKGEYGGLTIDNGNIYYILKGDLYQTNVYNNKHTLLVKDGSITNIYYFNNQLYYTAYNEELLKCNIYMLDLVSLSYAVVLENTDGLYTVDDGKIYYHLSYGLFTYNIETKENIKIKEFIEHEAIEYFDFKNNKMLCNFYDGNEVSIILFDIDTQRKNTLLKSEKSIYHCVLFGDWVFYFMGNNEDAFYYRIKTDGSQNELINDEYLILPKHDQA